MRIDSSYRQTISNKHTISKLTNNLFTSTLKEAEQEENKQTENKGKLVTAREGEYVRQYIVRADGSKIMLSEIKQSTDTADANVNYQSPAAALPFHTGNKVNNNTTSIMNLLNSQVGTAALTSPQAIKQLYSK